MMLTNHRPWKKRPRPSLLAAGEEWRSVVKRILPVSRNDYLCTHHAAAVGIQRTVIAV